MSSTIRETDNRDLPAQLAYAEARVEALRAFSLKQEEEIATLEAQLMTERQRTAKLDDQVDRFARIVKRLEGQLYAEVQRRATFWCREHGDFWYSDGLAPEGEAVCPGCEQAAFGEAEEEGE